MKKLFLFVAILCFSCCDREPIKEPCDESLLEDYGIGEFSGLMNDDVIEGFSFFRIREDSISKKMSFIFKSTHPIQCYYEHIYNVRTIRTLDLNDTIFLTEENEVASGINVDYDVTGAFFDADHTSIEDNWMILTNVVNDTTEISGKLNLRLKRDGKNESYPAFIELDNVQFRSIARS